MKALTLLMNEVELHSKRAVGEFDWLGCRFLRYSPKQGPLRRQVVAEIEKWLEREGYRVDGDSSLEVVAEDRRVLIMYSNIVFSPEVSAANSVPSQVRAEGFEARVFPLRRLPWNPYCRQTTVEIRRV